VSVTDNGKGFDAQGASVHQKGLGLINMQERLRLLGGFLRIHARPGDGTKVCAWLSLEETTS
jgi:two-component system sensor histidine kinase DegS